MNYSSIDEFYLGLFKASGHKVESGTDALTFAGKPVAVEIDGENRELILPTYDALRNTDRSRYAFFHVLAENIHRGKSEVFDHLHRTLMIKLNTATTMVGTGLISVALNTDLQRHFNREQIDIMRTIADVDEKQSLANWAKLTTRPLLKEADRMDTWLIQTNVKRNGTYKGKTYRRVGVVNFPAYEFIKNGGFYYLSEDKDAKKIGRTSDYAAYLQVVRAIYPEVDNAEAYNNGYEGMISPYLTAFMRSYIQLADRLNYILDVMAEPFSAVGVNREAVEINTEWKDYFLTEKGQDQVSDWLLKIPTLAGNSGVTKDREKSKEIKHREKLDPVEEAPREADKKDDKKSTALPWEDEKPVEKKEEVPTRGKLPWAAGGGGGSVRDLVGDLYEREREEDERERREREEDRRRREEKRRLQREDDDRRDRKRREERDREDDDERRRQEERRERERERDRERRGDDDDDDDDRRDRDRDRRDDRDRPASGKVSFTDILDDRPEIARGTPTEEDYRDDRDRGRRRSRRDYDDDYDDRDRRRDRRDRYYDDDRRDRDRGRRRRGLYRD